MRQIYLCRHGETEWSLSGQHTSYSDISLTPTGEKQAERLGRRLEGIQFVVTISSPAIRARSTCEFAGFTPDINPDLVEWNYGEYEGKTTVEIHQTVPNWSIFTHGAPGGESVEEVTARADRVIESLIHHEGDIALFSHGHFSRVLAARWIGLPTSAGAHLDLATASLSVLGYVREKRALKLWNETWFQQEPS